METDKAKQRQIDVSVCDTSGEEGTSRYVGALEARAFVFFFLRGGRGECLQEPFKRLHWLCCEDGSCCMAVGLRFASSEPGGQPWPCSHLYSGPGDWAWWGEGAVLECLGQQRRMEQVLNHSDDLLVFRGVTMVSGPGLSALYLHYHSTGAHTTPPGGPYLLFSIYR